MNISLEEQKPLWTQFVGEIPPNLGRIRPEILDSWKRCAHKVNSFQTRNPVLLREKEFNLLCMENRETMEVSTPIMESLYEFLRGWQVAVNLSDAHGYILKSIGDPDFIAELQRIHFLPGADWSEAVMGTHAIGTCLIIDQPLLVSPSEHWCICARGSFSSATPIYDPNQEQILGTLSILSAGGEEASPHSLGSVGVAAELIAAQIAARRTWMRLQRVERYRALVIESASDGLLLIDSSDRIIDINQQAADFLGIQGNPVERNIYEILEEKVGQSQSFRELASILKARGGVSQKFVSLRTESRVLQCTVSVRELSQGNSREGKLVVLRDLSSASPHSDPSDGNGPQIHFAHILGKNETFGKCKEAAMKAAKTSLNVLLTGESGTGKDLFAQAIHNSSPRADGPFVAINCGAIPHTLLASELFGYAGGAFTGARKGGSPGKFEVANHGTLFLDEIGEMPLEMQASLLRVLEEKRITRVGGQEAIGVDVRVIAATNKDLAQEVTAGRFRSDLYYRLNVIVLELPPLRQRKEDIPLLVEQLTRKIALAHDKQIRRIDPDFIEVCVAYHWPGNVRELQNILEKAISLTDEPVLSLLNFPTTLRSAILQNRTPESAGTKNSLRSFSQNAERDLISSELAKHRGNKSRVARELGISRSSLYRKLVSP